MGGNRGVPKAHSISNSTGKNYRILIASFLNENPKSSTRGAARSTEEWIDRIPDSTTQFLVRALAAELCNAKKNNK
jgi:hypothetical protein